MNSKDYARVMKVKHESVCHKIKRMKGVTAKVSKIQTKGRPANVYELSDIIIRRLVSSSRTATPEKLRELAEESGVSFTSIAQVTMSRSESQVCDGVMEFCKLLDGVKVLPQYGVAGRNIDIAVVNGNSILLIECDEECHRGDKSELLDKKRERDVELALVDKFDTIAWFRFSYEEPIMALAKIIGVISSQSVMMPLLVNNHYSYAPSGFRVVKLEK